MCKWKNLRIKYIGKIDAKCVVEFNLYGKKNTPWERFKIKIFEFNNGRFYGYTNLQIYLTPQKDDPNSAFGMGKTVEETFRNVLKDFYDMIHKIDNTLINNFTKRDPYDF